MSKIFAFFDTFRSAAGPHWVRTAIVVATGVYGAVSFLSGFAVERGWDFLIPTLPKVAYTIAALAGMLVFWFWRYAHQLRLETIPRIDLERIISRDSERFRDQVEVMLSIKNSGLTDLKNCLVKITDLSGSDGHFSPRALMTAAQSAESRSGSFNLRGGEPKEVPVCHYRKSSGATFAKLVIYFENGDVLNFDPDQQNIMMIGIYSEGPPTHAKLKFERSTDGLVQCTKISKVLSPGFVTRLLLWLGWHRSLPHTL